jgi:hypothetical protein
MRDMVKDPEADIAEFRWESGQEKVVYEFDEIVGTVTN